MGGVKRLFSQCFLFKQAKLRILLLFTLSIFAAGFGAVMYRNFAFAEQEQEEESRLSSREELRRQFLRKLLKRRSELNQQNVKLTPVPLGRYNVGYTIIEFEYTPVTGRTKEFDFFASTTQGTTRQMTVAVWYPSKDKEEPYDYNKFFGSEAKKLTSQVAFNGKLEEKGVPYPLIVFSHGSSGCDLQSLYIAEYLASQGYIFAAPDHLDNCTCTSNGGSVPGKLVDYPGDRKVPESGLLCFEFLEAEGFNPYTDFPSRPQDLKAVITEMLRLNAEKKEEAKNKETQPNFYQTINEKAIAVSGHSLGIWTSEVVSGVIPDGYAYLVDERITAGLFFTPSTEWTSRYAKDKYKEMKKPVMCLLGEKDLYSQSDQTSPRREVYDNALPPKFMPIVKEVRHYEFSDWPTCSRFATVDECLDKSLKAKTIVKYSLSFLNRYLKNDTSAEKILTTQALKDPMLLQPYEYDLGRSVSQPPTHPSQLPKPTPLTENIHNDFIPGETEIYNWIEKIVAQGIRRAGYPADKWTEDFCKKEFESFGLKDVHLQPVETERWEPRNLSLVISGSGDKVQLPCFPVAYGPATTETKGEIVKFTPELLDSDLSGKIIVFDYRLPEYPQKWIASKGTWVYDPHNTFAQSTQVIPLAINSKNSSELLKLIQRKPAAIVAVLKNYFESDNYFASWGGIWGAVQDSVPGVWISPANGQKLYRLLEKGANQASLKIDSTVENVITHNVIATLPGTSDEVIIITTHHDGSWASAVEDCSAMSVILGLAKYWSQVPIHERTHTLMFIMTAAHLAGMKGYADGARRFAKFAKDQKLIDKILLEIHLHHVGLEHQIQEGKLVPTGNCESRWVYTSHIPQLEEAVKQAIKEEDLQRSIMLSPTAFGPVPIMDGASLYFSGVPMLSYWTAPVYIMDSQDTLDKVDRKSLVPLTQAIIRIVLALRNQTAAGMRASCIEKENRYSESSVTTARELRRKFQQLKEARQNMDRGKIRQCIREIKELWNGLSKEEQDMIEKKYPGLIELIDKLP